MQKKTRLTYTGGFKETILMAGKPGSTPDKTFFKRRNGMVYDRVLSAWAPTDWGPDVPNVQGYSPFRDTTSNDMRLLGLSMMTGIHMPRDETSYGVWNSLLEAIKEKDKVQARMGLEQADVQVVDAGADSDLVDAEVNGDNQYAASEDIEAEIQADTGSEPEPEPIKVDLHNNGNIHPEYRTDRIGPDRRNLKSLYCNLPSGVSSIRVDARGRSGELLHSETHIEVHTYRGLPRTRTKEWKRTLYLMTYDCTKTNDNPPLLRTVILTSRKKTLEPKKIFEGPAEQYALAAVRQVSKWILDTGASNHMVAKNKIGEANVFEGTETIKVKQLWELLPLTNEPMYIYLLWEKT